MSEKTREVKLFQDTMYTLTLHGETIYKYKLLGLFGFHEYFWYPEYEHRLCRQVGASWGTSPTLPLKCPKIEKIVHAIFRNSLFI